MDTSRRLSTALALGRIGLGLAFVAAPEQTGGRWIGGVARSTGAQVMVRAMGIRDAALGAATLGTLRATGTGGTGFKVLTGLGIVVDVVDCVATLTAGDEVPNGRLSAAIAGGAAATGVAVLATSGDG
jgi:hypothetical protein